MTNNSSNLYGFESFLIEKGYKRFRCNIKKMVFEPASLYDYFSTMENIDFRYFHESDPVIDKINTGGIIGKDITWEDRKGEISFGLNEHPLPPTLISPRPRIIKSTLGYNGGLKVINEKSDQAMSAALEEFDYELIFEAMYDKSMLLLIIIDGVNQKTHTHVISIYDYD